VRADDLFADGIFGDFFGYGSRPPESVARKILGIGTSLPLDREGVAAAFRFGVRLLRPDLADEVADRLRLRDIIEGEVPEFDAADSLRFDSGSKEEQLAELLWAREDLLRRLPPPVTTSGGRSRAATTPTAPVTQWGNRQRERREQHKQWLRERDERAKKQREKWEAEKPERDREAHRLVRREARWRRSQRRSRELRCHECHEVIDRGDVAVVGEESWGGDEFVLDPYAVSRSYGWWSRGGYYHAACLLDASVRPIGWLEQYLADGVPLETECEVCGRRVKPPRWIRRRDGGKVFYCSEECAGGADAIARRIEPTPRACAVCGETFTPARSDARYCSGACRQDAYRKRKLGGAPAA
jgi:hypothetical protein